MKKFANEKDLASIYSDITDAMDSLSGGDAPADVDEWDEEFRSSYRLLERATKKLDKLMK
jgi:hypothetical protein